jgi:hypothetical protein
LFKKLLADNNRQLIEQDVAGTCHFHPHITNAGGVQAILTQLAAAGYAPLVRRESAWVLEMFGKMFDHRSFTGRSGTFFGYEGLGCIYWHMVSKLLLSAQESFARARGSPLTRRLAESYHDVRTGLRDFKTPENYGAFPMDPYSHTPAHTGARQPGLTGQVKEDILCRWGELGVSVRGGKIQFEPHLLHPAEFLTAPDTFTYYDVAGLRRKIQLKAGMLAFTYCQVPVVYQLAAKPFLRIEFTGGRQHRQDVPVLDETISRAIFSRAGSIQSIFCGLDNVSLAAKARAAV